MTTAHSSDKISENRMLSLVPDHCRYEKTV